LCPVAQRGFSLSVLGLQCQLVAGGVQWGGSPVQEKRGTDIMFGEISINEWNVLCLLMEMTAIKIWMVSNVLNKQSQKS
jgi:hypothetical protein